MVLRVTRVTVTNKADTWVGPREFARVHQPSP